MEPDETISNLEVLDFFAGAARVARGARALCLKAAAFDIGYHHEEKVFDLKLNWRIHVSFLQSNISKFQSYFTIGCAKTRAPILLVRDEK